MEWAFGNDLVSLHKGRAHHVLTKKMVGYQKNDSMTPRQKLLAGCISGVTTRFITQPMDVIKIRTQLQQKQALETKDKWFGTTRKILSEEGITAFWHGHNLGQVLEFCTFVRYIFNSGDKG